MRFDGLYNHIQECERGRKALDQHLAERKMVRKQVVCYREALGVCVG